MKGLIITASVLVAAGIAFYENEHIREFILNYRRKLALALHSLGDEIQPNPSSSREKDDEEARRRRREEIVRLNRLEMIRQAREEGIAVDLDELVKMGEDGVTGAEGEVRREGERYQSFDALVGADGTLRKQEMAQASGSDNIASGMRQRGAGARGLDAGSAMADPFDDEAQILFEREMIGNSMHSEKSHASRESSRTLSPAPMDDSASQYYSEDEMEAQIEEAIRRSMQDQTVNKSPSIRELPDVVDIMDREEDVDADPPISVPQSVENSYYYAPPPNVSQPPLSNQSMYSSAMEAMLAANMQSPLSPHAHTHFDDADDEAPTPSGTLTPTEDGQSNASLAGSQAEDIGRLSDFHSMADEHDIDARSEATNDSFSIVGGTDTPTSWTDVESEAGDEEGHAAPHVATVNAQ